MDSITPTMNLEEAMSMLEGTLGELRDTQAQLETCQEQLLEMNMLVFEQSATDPLTGLKNRAAFDRIMNQQSARTGRSQSPLALLMVDVDKLHAYNEEFGRHGGDEVLQQVAQVLRTHARAYDYVVRYEDDQFAVVLPDTAVEGAKVVADRVRSSVKAIRWRHRGMTVSIGIAGSTADGSGRSIADRAVSALKSAKASGGDRVMEDRLPA
jgi:diguanylate cyclase (GGDEF)-like protein